MVREDEDEQVAINEKVADILEEEAEDELDPFYYLHFIQKSDENTRELMGKIISNQVDELIYKLNPKESDLT